MIVYILIGTLGTVLPLLGLIALGLTLIRDANSSAIYAKRPLACILLAVAILASVFLFVYSCVAHSLWVIFAISFICVETVIACALLQLSRDFFQPMSKMIRYCIWHAFALTAALTAFTLALYL